jgi:hypothetical protein
MIPNVSEAQISTETNTKDIIFTVIFQYFIKHIPGVTKLTKQAFA